MIRRIGYDESLDGLWTELVYTEARLKKNAFTKALATPITKLVDRTEKVTAGQRAAWRAEIVAQAGVDEANDALDDTVDGVAHEILHVVRDDRAHPRYGRYFKNDTPGHVIRLGLASELEIVRPWAPSLKKEPEAALKTLGKTLDGRIAGGQTALAERETAARETADHRVHEIVHLVDDVNAARLSLYGALTTIAAENGLPSTFAARFFHRAMRTGSVRGGAPDPTPPAAAPPAAQTQAATVAAPKKRRRRR